MTIGLRVRHRRDRLPPASPAVFVIGAVELVVDVALIAIGSDRTPGNWNDMVVLMALNPAAHVVLLIVFLVASLVFWKRFESFSRVGSVLLPLLGSVIVHNGVYHRR